MIINIIVLIYKLRRTWSQIYKDQVLLTLFLAASGGGCTPFISKLLSSLEANVFLRWMLMKPDGMIKDNFSSMKKHDHHQLFPKCRLSYLVRQSQSFG